MIRKRFKHYHTNHVVETYDENNMMLLGAPHLTLIPNEVIHNGQDWNQVVPFAIKYNDVLYKENGKGRWQADMFIDLNEKFLHPIWEEEEITKDEC